jgi:flagellar hook protein FlgE
MGSSAFYIGLSGLDSFSTAISVTGDNIANAATTGFKSSSVLFVDMVSNYYTSGTAMGDKMGAGTSVIGTLKDFSEGSISSTGTWTDVALNGDGFFAVKLAGSTQTYYTRDGSFRLDSSGYLVNGEGYQVLGTDGNPIQVDTTLYSNMYVDSTGQVYGTDASGTVTAIGEPLLLTQFSNQNGLIRQGSNLYTAGGEVGTTTTNATATLNVKVEDAALETSNVDLSSEMVNLIIYEADYNANAKTITTANDMLDTVINMIR